MKLDLGGKTAIVCGASKGIGRACALALAEEGVRLVIVARGRDDLESAADTLRQTVGASVTTVPADVTSEDGRSEILAACPKPDILVTNGPSAPSGDFRAWDRAAWIAALDANMLAPIALMRGVIDGMVERQFGRIVNITAAGVKAPPSNFGLSNGARAGLTGFVAGLAREVAKANVTINNILPGMTNTERGQAMLAHVAKARGLSADDVAASLTAAIPAGRFAESREVGLVCAFLCSVHSGYVTGQNLVVDGGAYPGMF